MARTDMTSAATIRRDLKALQNPWLRDSGALQRFLHQPNFWARPAARTFLSVARPSGIGDVLMCTPALRALKQINPACRIDFYTDLPDLIAGLPYIDNVYPFAAAPWRKTIHFKYEFGAAPKAHISRLFGDQIGLRITDTRPDCVVHGDSARKFAKLLEPFPKPWIVMLRKASGWTPNKDWPNESWDQLIQSLDQFGTIIEVGASDETIPAPAPQQNHLDFRNKTDLKALVGLIKVADVYVGPVSGPVHIAAAVGTRSVVIYGGYEPPAIASYAGQINLVNAPPCSPCWLSTPCSFNLRCLRAIKPAEVAAALRSLPYRLKIL